MRFNISIMTQHGSYEFTIEGGKDLPKMIKDAYAKGDAISFTDVDGSDVILSPLNVIGIIVKDAAEDERETENSI